MIEKHKRQLSLKRRKHRKRSPVEGSLKSKSTLPILIIQHSPSEQPALLDRIFESQAVRRTLLHPYLGESFPNLDEISGIISLGGPMSAFEEDSHPWIASECRFLKEAHSAGLPIIGICLGGQLLAKALGASVERAPEPEMGWLPIEINQDGLNDPIFGAIAETLGPEIIAYHWHQDTFHLPESAVLLARTSACPRQAYRVGSRAYGLQFHPEVDSKLVSQWLEESGTEDEIRAFRVKHPRAMVQDAIQQKHHSLVAEEFNAALSAAIATLFRQGTPAPSKISTAQLRKWKVEETLLNLKFRGTTAQYSLEGRVSRVLDTTLGTFVLFKATDRSLWPLQLESIKDVRPAQKSRVPEKSKAEEKQIRKKSTISRTNGKS